MCGIVGYVGNRDACPIVIKGLQRLEYRGYDSAGICVGTKNQLEIIKAAGKVADLESLINDDIRGNIAMGHTRWATHGEPNKVNSHPHTSESDNLAIIHNGIIENYDSIKKALIDKDKVSLTIKDVNNNNINDLIADVVLVSVVENVRLSTLPSAFKKLLTDPPSFLNLVAVTIPLETMPPSILKLCSAILY